MRHALQRLFATLRHRRAEEDLAREVAGHLALVEDEYRRRGMPPEDAQHAARRAMGGVEQAKERHRDARAFRWLEDLRQDVRYALRGLGRSPGFTTVVVLTLALGIGANTAIFSAIDALLLRSAPIRDPDRVVSVYLGTAERAFGTVSYPNFVDLRESGVFEDLVAFSGIRVAFDDGERTERIEGQIVTGDYFDTLGVRPMLGRSFAPDEDRRGNPVRVVVVSHVFWQSRLGADPAAVGRAIVLNGRSYTVVGVTPPAFTGLEVGAAPLLWVPMAMQAEVRPPSSGFLRRQMEGSFDLLSRRQIGWLDMIGRLEPGSTADQVTSALAVVAGRLARHPDNDIELHATALPLGEGPGVRAETRPLLGLLAGATALVLLIVCANVAGLLLARMVSRRRELALRRAIGATGGRLVRQALTESVLVGLAGGAAGLIVAQWGMALLYALGVPEVVDLRLGVRVLLFALAAAGASGVLAGLAGVVQLLRRDTMSALRDEGVAVTTGLRAARFRGALVALQVALSVVLLVAAGLFLRTLQNAYAVDLGYSVERVLLADLVLDVGGYTEEVGQQAYRRVLDAIAALPGVEAVGAARVAVLSGSNRVVPVSTDGQPVEFTPGGLPDNAMLARVNVVTDGYFDALGIRLLRGRAFDDRDGPSTPQVAIVTRSLADRLWPGVDPIGRELVMGDAPFQVIGVAPDTVYVSAIEQEPPPFFYLPVSQNYESGLTLHVRTAGEPLAMLAGVRQIVREVDSRLVVSQPRTLGDELAGSVRDERLMATMVGLFGGLALLLAAIGLYGVMAHAVGQRTREIGVRLALGADRRAITTLVAAQGARMVALGTVAGLAVALAAARLIQARLFGVGPTDPLTFAAVVAVLVAAALLACLVPVRRATKVDPLEALRYE